MGELQRKLIDKKNATIKQLQAELDKHRWTPVREGLPEVPDGPPNAASKKVWVIYKGQAGKGYYTNFAGWRVRGVRFQKRLNQKDITHWMPIPQLPEQKRCKACADAKTTCLREIIKPCKTCGGSKRVPVICSLSLDNPSYIPYKPCSACNGSGKENSDG